MTNRDTSNPLGGGTVTGLEDSSNDGGDDTIYDQITQLIVRQLQFRRYIQQSLGTDHDGLTTMIHLMQVGADSPTAIASNLEKSTAATSLVLNRLEASGHISRQPHPTDQRKVVVIPARASLVSAAQLASPAKDSIDNLTAALTPGERSTVVRFLNDLIHVYEDALPAGNQRKQTTAKKATSSVPTRELTASVEQEEK